MTIKTNMNLIEKQIKAFRFYFLMTTGKEPTWKQCLEYARTHK